MRRPVKLRNAGAKKKPDAHRDEWLVTHSSLARQAFWFIRCFGREPVVGQQSEPESLAVESRCSDGAVLDLEHRWEAFQPRLVRGRAVLSPVPFDGRDGRDASRQAGRVQEGIAGTRQVLDAEEQAEFLSGRAEQQRIRVPFARLDRHARVAHFASE